MIDVALAGAIIATVIFIWLRIEPRVDRTLSLSERKLKIEERRVEIEHIATVKPAIRDDDPMPQDMAEWAMNESTEWAQDDMLKRMRELYDRLHDWPKVRAALMHEEGTSDAARSTFS